MNKFFDFWISQVPNWKRFRISERVASACNLQAVSRKIQGLNFKTKMSEIRTHNFYRLVIVLYNAYYALYALGHLTFKIGDWSLGPNSKFFYPKNFIREWESEKSLKNGKLFFLRSRDLSISRIWKSLNFNLRILIVFAKMFFILLTLQTCLFKIFSLKVFASNTNLSILLFFIFQCDFIRISSRISNFELEMSAEVRLALWKKKSALGALSAVVGAWCPNTPKLCVFESSFYAQHAGIIYF